MQPPGAAGTSGIRFARGGMGILADQGDAAYLYTGSDGAPGGRGRSRGVNVIAASVLTISVIVAPAAGCGPSLRRTARRSRSAPWSRERSYSARRCSSRSRRCGGWRSAVAREPGPGHRDRRGGGAPRTRRSVLPARGSRGSEALRRAARGRRVHVAVRHRDHRGEHRGAARGELDMSYRGSTRGRHAGRRANLLWAGAKVVGARSTGLLDEADFGCSSASRRCSRPRAAAEWCDIHQLRCRTVGRRKHVDLHLGGAALLRRWTRRTGSSDALGGGARPRARGRGDFVVHIDPCRPMHCGGCAMADCPVAIGAAHQRSLRRRA